MLTETIARAGQIILRDTPPDGRAYWAARFWDRDAVEAHPEISGDLELQKKAIAEYFRSYAGDVGTVVEFGCGTGLFTQMSAELTPAKQITALDISKQGLELTRRRVNHDDLRLIEGDFWSEHGLGKADLVVCVDAIHHLGDVEAVLRRLHSFVRPGGLFIGNAMILDEFHDFQRRRYGHAGHLLRTSLFLASAVMVKLTGGRVNTGAYRTQLRHSADIGNLLSRIFPEVLDVSIDPGYMAFACRC
ncbi:bifunctional 2-polyprenyl-6-hydroxyphenol methylase/3-demethylubiquinol 3-O-methyltransferase UbiG [Nocardia sp. CC227C]|uniref:class I SAM-dependent methyltransferase n=1 Tax=Nocardia sp. CC227C TaxID=3044562 RepID=UPI00278C105B|nr:class I SAM-dependent methyltransferase [Nocardia sp. CC227C]